MADICPEFSKEVQNGDIIVGGENFGCGSSREHAPLAIKGCGVSSVIAKSFARIFFRNCINIGLPILEIADADKLSDEEIIKRVGVSAFPKFIQDIIDKGGLMGTIE